MHRNLLTTVLPRATRPLVQRQTHAILQRRGAIAAIVLQRLTANARATGETMASAEPLHRTLRHVTQSADALTPHITALHHASTALEEQTTAFANEAGSAASTARQALQRAHMAQATVECAADALAR